MTMSGAEGLTCLLMHQGIQLYVEVEDVDVDLRKDDNIVDVFLIDIPNTILPGTTSPSQTINGIYGLGAITLAYQVLCPEGHFGPACQYFNDCLADSCSGNGPCIDRMDETGINCSCLPGYTGQSCEVNINECEDIDCSRRGECVDEIAGFRCDCDSSQFSGRLCETDTEANRAALPIRAAVGSGAVAVIIVTLSVLCGCMAWMLWRHWTKKEKGESKRGE